MDRYTSRSSTWLPLLLTLMAANVRGAVPHAINLEGRLTDPSGNPILTATQVEFRIFQGGDATTADSGNLVYREITTITPAADGTYAYLLGTGSAIQGYQFTSAVFDSAQNVYLQLNIDNQAVLPRLQIVSAATAMLPEFPAGFIGMFAADCPTGWTRFTNLNGVFPRGADTGNLGGAGGGAASHSHSLGAPSHVETGVVFSSGQGSGSFWGNWAREDHVHSVSTESNIPPYLDVVYCQKI